MDSSSQSFRVLTITLLSAMLPLLAAALCLGAYLNFASVRTNYLALVSDRLDTVARRIASDAQMALSLGLPLGGQTVLDRTLVREKDADPGIETIDVVNSTGKILFSTDPAREGTTFERVVDDPLAREALIASGFGTVEGAVVSHADRKVVGETLDTLFQKVLTAAVATFVLGGLAIGVLVFLTVRVMGRRVTALSRTARGRSVPAETARTIDAVDRAHDQILKRLGGIDGAF